MVHFRICCISFVCFVWLQFDINAQQRNQRKDDTFLLSTVLAWQNTIRSGEWDVRSQRRFASLPVATNRTLIAIEVVPSDNLFQYVHGEKSQVFVSVWRDDFHGMIHMPVVPMSPSGLITELQSEGRSVWSDLGVTTEHVKLLSSLFRNTRNNEFRVAPEPVSPEHSKEWELQLQLLTTGLSEEVKNRTITNGVIMVRDFGVFDANHIGVCYSDGVYWEVNIEDLRQRDSLEVVHFNVRLVPVDMVTYERTVKVVKQLSNPIVWVIRRGELFMNRWEAKRDIGLKGLDGIMSRHSINEPTNVETNGIR